MTRIVPSIPVAASAMTTQAPPSIAAEASAMGELGPYFRMLWGLLVVLGVMLILYGVVRRRFSILGGRSGGTIKVLEIRPLMPKKSLCLVSVRGKEYLLGIGSDSITLIADIGSSHKESFKEILTQSEEGAP